MSKKDFISGSILEFKLPMEFGYAYCKILDFRHIRLFDGVLVKVFDQIVKQPLQEIDILHNIDWLFGARRMPYLPGTRGKGAWKLRGVFIAEEDKIIPDFKYCIKDSYIVEDPSKIGPWNFVRNINICKPSEYEKVKHLEDTVVSPRLGIEIRTAMEYCRANNLDIKKHFDLNYVGNEITYKQMINIPIYSSIPKEIRGRAIE